MPLTAQRQAEAFISIADNVLGLSQAEKDAFTAIGCDTIYTFINLDDAAFSTVRVDDGNGGQTQLTPATRNIIMPFFYYLSFLDHKAESPHNEEWFNVSADDFSDFRQSQSIKY